MSKYIFVILYICIISCQSNHTSEQKKKNKMEVDNHATVSLSSFGYYAWPIKIMKKKRYHDTLSYQIDLSDTLGGDGSEGEAKYCQNKILNVDITLYREMGNKTLNYQFDSEGVNITSVLYRYNTPDRVKISDADITLDTQFNFYWKWQHMQTCRLDSSALQILNSLLKTLPEASNLPK